jgi:hypothetical protein
VLPVRRALPALAVPRVPAETVRLRA